MQTFAVEVQCVACGEVENIYVEPMDYVRWNKGTHIQDAFPYLTADEREALITSMCVSCVEEIYADLEEDENDWEGDDFPEYERDWYVD